MVEAREHVVPLELKFESPRGTLFILKCGHSLVAE